MPKEPYAEFAYFYDKTIPDKWYLGYYRVIKGLFNNLNPKPRRILELASGTGRMLKLLSKGGYDAEGLDLSKSMLSAARKKGLRVHYGNMLRFKLKKEYDAILCLNYSLNEIKSARDLSKVFQNVKEHLAPDGAFIFDIETTESAGIGNKKVEVSTSESGGLIITFSNVAKGSARKITFDVSDKYSNGKRYHVEIVTRAYPKKEIMQICRKNGLKMRSIKSKYDNLFICINPRSSTAL
ncbi:MAG: class I SAM-dependent methyltransferase [Candidatus Micrarchaeota archaeon]|nr:class I SAM-dependent methyltransferase [Candidatus Micrarchaeota archaeon]MDE1864333.1 class I SAM-dependent methyltransferase [Candidatus Micrarchaeota archaeon]